jgi:1-pyrroline-5-carboxylate dehydrogenase
MSNAFFNVPTPVNEPVTSFAPGTPERESLQAMYNKMNSEVIDIPMFIGGKEVYTNDKRDAHPPHEHAHTIAR